MILSFSTKINGKPTYFIDKIWIGLCLKHVINAWDLKPIFDDYRTKFGKSLDQLKRPLPDNYFGKIHTIRKDEKQRWKPGKEIHFYINNRTKEAFQFAPVTKVMRVQRIFMTFLPQCGLGFRVSINGRELEGYEVEELAINDGFEAVEDFEDYFIKQMENDEFSGKIIHWTDFKY